MPLDGTNGKRLGYLYGAEYGSIFAENRYTASGNAFPHRVLRNLWMLSRVLPASRLQFELVNPDLNRECYAPDDPFAPVHYDMDYLFAAVMLSNPLFWMEMQFLSRPRRDELARLMPVWRQHRDTLGRADVRAFLFRLLCPKRGDGLSAAVPGEYRGTGVLLRLAAARPAASGVARQQYGRALYAL